VRTRVTIMLTVKRRRRSIWESSLVRRIGVIGALALAASVSALQADVRKFTLSRDDAIYECFPDLIRLADGTLICLYRESDSHTARDYTVSGVGNIGGDVNNGSGTISPGNSSDVRDRSALLTDGSLSVVPEPASMVLCMLAIIGPTGIFLSKRH